jgi:hypothetical protein
MADSMMLGARPHRARGEPGPRAEPPAETASVPAPRRRRPRLALEITVVLLVKLLLLYAIWVAWFAQPVSRGLDARSVAARLLGANPILPETKVTR